LQRIYIGSWRAPEVKEVREREEEKQTKERTMATQSRGWCHDRACPCVKRVRITVRFSSGMKAEKLAIMPQG
jgi:hypothetical protein